MMWWSLNKSGGSVRVTRVGADKGCVVRTLVVQDLGVRTDVILIFFSVVLMASYMVNNWD